MNLNHLWIKRYIKIYIIIICTIVIVGLLPLIFFESHPIITAIKYILNLYASIAENITNSILKSLNSDAIISNHKFILINQDEYITKHKELIPNWTNYLMFKKWSAFILLIIWATFTSINKKILFTVFFAITHFISVIVGLLTFTYVGPIIIAPHSISKIDPSVFGSLALFSILVYWIKDQRLQIEETIRKINIKLNLKKKETLQIIVIIYLYLLLKNFIVPYLNFYLYIDFLLGATQYSVALLGYEAIINGPYLIGASGTLYMAKWCLGFLTMYTFASLVYLTSNNQKTKWLYIVAGIIFLHIVNITRLAALFIFVQSNSDSQLAHDHHDIYNILVYIIIFILWVIWFEKFADIKPLKKKKK